jgi:hypothetical protein
MAKTVVGMFHSRDEAERVARDLEQLVPDPREIQVVDAHEVEEHPARHESRETGSFWSWLFGDVNEAPEDRYYDEGVQRGDVLVMVTTSDERADLVQELMEQSGLADDVEQREARDDGEIGAETTPSSATQETEPPPVVVVEERVEFGPHGIRRTVRAYTHVVERPVEDQIRLRDERMRSRNLRRDDTAA